MKNNLKQNQVIQISDSNLIKKIEVTNCLNLEISKNVYFQEIIDLTLNPVNNEVEIKINIQENSDIRISLNLINIEINELNLNLNINLKKNARLSFLTHQYLSLDAKIFAETKFEIAEDSELNFLGTTFGGKNITNKIQSKINKNAISNISNIFFSSKDQNLELLCENVFLEQSGGGEIQIRGVAKDNSKAKIEGIIKIGKNASNTNTYLKEDVLILGEKAKINAIPSLEIDTNDVKASHGVSVAKLNDEDLFFLESRGLNKETAESMIIEGFLGELLEEKMDSNFKEIVLESIRKKIKK